MKHYSKILCASLSAATLLVSSCGSENDEKSSETQTDTSTNTNVGTTNTTTETTTTTETVTTTDTVTNTDVTTVEANIVINEVRSTGDFDYIELYNAGDESFAFTDGLWSVNDLKGLTEDLEPGIQIPADTVLESGEILLIAVNSDSVPFGVPANTIIPTGNDAGFGLGKGDTALLVHNGEAVDEIKWEDGTHVESFGRFPDGENWHAQTESLHATPGAINELPITHVAASANDIVINEVVSKGRDDVDFDFVELYNNSSSDYTFADAQWELRDGDLAEEESGLFIPDGTIIPAHGFLVLIPGEESLPVGAPQNSVVSLAGEDFGLGKEETITLKFENAVHQQISYGDFHVNSYGRFPDGAELIALLDENAPQLYASPGHKNFMAPMHIVIANTLNFSAFNDQESTLENDGFRVFGPNADLATDVEPEYVAVSADSSTAWVSLQENNGIARIDLATQTIEAIMPLGFKDYGLAGNEIDASDKDDVFALQSFQNVVGMYQPDGIATFMSDGVNYVISANEGDVRDWMTNFDESLRVEDATLDQSVFTNAADLQTDEALGRLTITKNVASATDESVMDKIYSFGARSFTIWNGQTGALVFDSGSELADHAQAQGYLDDGRSDAKGVEPETVTIGNIGEKTFAFIGLERADAVAVYDITDPSAPVYQQMLNHSGDDAPEGLLFISAEHSPNAQPLLVVSNEDSGNISIYQSDANGVFAYVSGLAIEGGEGAAEISAFDSSNQRLFVLNNAESIGHPRIEVIDLSDVTAPAKIANIDTSYYGAGINSVSIHNGLIAAAIQADDKTLAGTVVVFDTNTYELKLISKVGALPDMITFTHDGTALITADEGEPNDDYSKDPIGSVSIISMP